MRFKEKCCNDFLAIVDNKMLHDMIVRMTWTVDISCFRFAIMATVGSTFMTRIPFKIETIYYDKS